jgi:hypothetical protein
MSSEDNEGRTVLDVASAEVVKALMELKRTNEVALRMAAREGRTATVRATLATAVTWTSMAWTKMDGPRCTLPRIRAIQRQQQR